MNLEIQLAWCRHWIREQLGMPANGSLVVFLDDHRTCDAPIAPPVVDAIRTVAIESRWQFSRAQCVLVSVVNGSNHLKNKLESSLYGIIDQQTSVDNAADLCGWIGASNSIFILEQGPSHSHNPRIHNPLQFGFETNLLQTIAKVGTGFRKPWNSINKTNAQQSLANLDWERMHQPSATPRNTDTAIASIPFSEAVIMLEAALGKTRPLPNTSLEETTGFRQAG